MLSINLYVGTLDRHSSFIMKDYYVVEIGDSESIEDILLELNDTAYTHASLTIAFFNTEIEIGKFKKIFTKIKGQRQCRWIVCKW